MKQRYMKSRAKPLVLMALLAALAGCATHRDTPKNAITISIVSANDVHGELISKPDRGGIAGLSGFVDALRAARAVDGGSVLFIDAGDMWQGTLESNLVEGAAVVDAYNAMGITAAAIGNHEFDFGPVGERAIPEDDTDDPRGALKQRAGEIAFPLLAANLIDEATGLPVTWQNVQPSALINVQEIRVGIIGVLSKNALQATISANTRGLRVAPLVDTITSEARKLRAAGANLVIVAAHAGGRCTEFHDPSDLSSCNLGGEIMRVAEALEAGLVDHIVAGHVHQGIAHVVNGISITSSYSNTRAFSRTDIEIGRESGAVLSRKVFPPQQACLRVVAPTGRCATGDDDPAMVTDAVYEGRRVIPNPVVAEIAGNAQRFAEAIKDEPLGVRLESAFLHPPSTESPLANLMTDAVLQSVGGDVAVHNVVGGIRSILPAGELTFGAVYEMFPFDNRIVVLDVSGGELRKVLAHQAHRAHRRAGIAGIRAAISCDEGQLQVVATRLDGREILDEERLSLVVNDFLALGGDDILTPIIPGSGFDIDESMPLVRDVLVAWFRSGPEILSPTDFLTTENPKWNVPDALPPTCRL